MNYEMDTFKVADSACFKLEEQTWQQKKQWNTEDDFSKSTH